MPDQSHREEMSAAIRAQRERNAVPRTIAPESSLQPERAALPEPEEAAPEPRRRQSLFGRLRRN
jgi:hypothetical protein